MTALGETAEVPEGERCRIAGEHFCLQSCGTGGPAAFGEGSDGGAGGGTGGSGGGGDDGGQQWMMFSSLRQPAPGCHMHGE